MSEYMWYCISSWYCSAVLRMSSEYVDKANKPNDPRPIKGNPLYQEEHYSQQIWFNTFFPLFDRAQNITCQRWKKDETEYIKSHFDVLQIKSGYCSSLT